MILADQLEQELEQAVRTKYSTVQLQTIAYAL